MNLQNYTWNNGTQNNPIVLDNNQIKKLLAIGQTENVNTAVKGWITTSSRKMQKFLKYSLEQSFPELNIICDEALEDLFTIRATNSVIREGTKEQIIVNSDTGVTSSFLKWKYEYSDFLIDGDISQQNIKDRIRVKDGYLEVDAPKENASWSVTLKLTAYPSYYSESEFNSIPVAAKPYLTFVIMAKKIEDVIVNIEDDIPVNASISANVKPVPEDSTKLAGAFYTYSTTTPELINISTTGFETEVIAKNKGLANLTVTVHACNNTITKTNTISFVVYDSIRPMTFFIDQRGITSDPDSMVSKNYIVKTNGALIELSDNAASGDPDVNVLSWIRKNTHAYVGKYSNAVMQLKQLDDTNRAMFADGTSAANYINDETGTYDVWMKIDSDVYFKSEAAVPPGFDEPDDNYIAITIARELPIGEDESAWQKWSQYNLVGVYKSCIINNALHSLSGKRAANNLTNAEFITKATSRGPNFNITNYLFYRLLFVLFSGYYSTLNTKAICGFGTKNDYNSVNYPKITGSTDNLAGIDTNYSTGTGNSSPNSDQIIAGEGTDIKTTNFWNLESLYDDLAECIIGLEEKILSSIKNNINSYSTVIHNGKIINPSSDYIDSLNGSTSCVIVNDDPQYVVITNNIRNIYDPSGVKTLSFCNKCDIIRFSNSSTTTDIYFCCNQSIQGWGESFIFGNGSNNSDNGIASINTPRYFNKLKGARLMYKGNKNLINIIEDNSTL